MKTAKQSKLFPRRRDSSTGSGTDPAVPAKELASVPTIIANVFGKLDRERRARLLGRLLGSVGPLALAVVGGGVFAKYLRNARWPEVPISFEDAARVTSSQVHDLAHYVEQSNPHLVQSLSAALFQDGMTMAALGASVAAIAVKHLSGPRDWKAESSIKKSNATTQFPPRRKDPTGKFQL
jgi:hypothetical protein